MALTTAAAATAATVLGAMYLDAKLLIRSDLGSGALAPLARAMAVKYLAQRVKEDRMTVYHDIEFHAKSQQNSSNIFLIFEGRTWTYAEFFRDIQRVGNWLMNDLGIERGEIVALNGTNSPEYIMLWYALEGIGAAPAFINCNLTAGPLLHCAKIGGTRYMLVDEEVRKLVEPVESQLKDAGCGTVYYSSQSIAELKDTTELPRSRTSGIQPTDICSLLFTSGTTGMPKAIKKIAGWSVNLARSMGMYLQLKPGVRMYTCLPLYHGAAIGLCMTPSISGGSTVVLSRKFSHKTFWPEVRESKATMIQYVGELCRYLVNAPPSPLDKQHDVKIAWGNGMRSDVWKVFQDRFGIEVIHELYAASDGLNSSFNYNKGEFGKFAIGKRGTLWHLVNKRNDTRIRIDQVTQEIIRGDDGFAIECKDGEPGEAVIRMDPATAKTVFSGYYNNDEATEKRLIYNLLKKGDLWFRSGDLMRLDPDGCLHFVDRLGDTYRWKSENVSTNEVGDVVGAFDQIAEANVYGVQVPNADGRCGCAAIVLVNGLGENQLDLDRLAKHTISTLPRYAVPIFLRVVKELQYTGTMKMQKGKLREEGIDLDKISSNPSTKDAMYWLPPGQSTYVPFKSKDFEELKAGRVRL